MHLKGDYNPVQDRILLRFWDDAAPSGDTALWLTRRQWVAIALACYRARSANAQQDGQQPVRPRKNVAGKEPASGLGEGAESGAMGSRGMQGQAIGPGKGGRENVKVSLVTEVKFHRIPSGLRIKMTTEAPSPLFLTLKGESFTLFTGMVESLAAKAKWNLPAAISCVSNAVTARKRIVH